MINEMELHDLSDVADTALSVQHYAKEMDFSEIDFPTSRENGGAKKHIQY